MKVVDEGAKLVGYLYGELVLVAVVQRFRTRSRSTKVNRVCRRHLKYNSNLRYRCDYGIGLLWADTRNLANQGESFQDTCEGSSGSLVSSQLIKYHPYYMHPCICVVVMELYVR